tara:strand:+ start:497 stop:754 length:258 start_codon:yes stop_codon:yes gene_type:complete
MADNNLQTKAEMDTVIKDLEAKGVKFNTKEEDMTGLGDVVESTLQKFGITEERFKAWFGLEECNCSKRKKFLNNLFSWKKKSSEG